jgi:hypothetical protein
VSLIKRLYTHDHEMGYKINPRPGMVIIRDEIVSPGLHCPMCRKRGYRRHGLHFDHEFRCGECDLSWEPDTRVRLVVADDASDEQTGQQTELTPCKNLTFSWSILHSSLVSKTSGHPIP